MLETFLQGAETDARLFGLVGRLALSPAVHKSLGNAVSSEDGDWWFVNTRPSDIPDGFAQMRVNASSVHLRYCYSDKASIKMYMIKAALRKAKELGASIIFTNERKGDDVLPGMGFTAVPSKRKGDFVRWEKTL